MSMNDMEKKLPAPPLSRRTNPEPARGTIFNIQKFSIHDGPGIRSTVFFKSCPLRCLWCHNPEGLEKEPSLLYFSERCRSCGRCQTFCPTRAIRLNAAKRASSDGIQIDRARCLRCGRCAESCHHGALSLSGREIGVEELMREILRDRVFYEESGGGVTFSGGEPMSQPEFLLALLRRGKEEGLHTAIDTSGYASWENFERMMPFCDLFLFDLKGMKDEIHQKTTGCSNQLILENLRQLSGHGARIRVRIPLIRGVNDGEEERQKLLDFLKGIQFEQIHLLEYHRMGREKYARLGMENLLSGEEKPARESVALLRGALEKEGWRVVQGG